MIVNYRGAVAGKQLHSGASTFVSGVVTIRPCAVQERCDRDERRAHVGERRRQWKISTTGVRKASSSATLGRPEFSGTCNRASGD